jgi:lysyl endopeptidase
MHKKLLGLCLLFVFSSLVAGAQSALHNGVKSIPRHYLRADVPTLTLTPPDREALRAEDQERDKKGELYRIGVSAFTQLTTANSGKWTALANGDRIWQLHAQDAGAEALSFLFSTFRLYDAATINVYNASGRQLHKTLTAADVLEHGQQNMSLCFGDDMFLELREPANTRPSEIIIDRVMYGYRSTGNPQVQLLKFNDSESCEVNVNCAEGDNWQDEKKGVARILVVNQQEQGYCTGSLVNNTALDCKPLFLTALHCGVDVTTSDFNQWRFYFRYESPNCANPASEGTLANHFLTGCVKLASSNDGGGDSGSDFLLVHIGAIANEAATITTLKSANFNAYWNGWDANNTAATSGVGIHHPSGDIKKISTFTSTLTTSAWNNNNLASHWRVTWIATTNGHGVTEPGSSGSPIFASNGGNSRIVGTLTGGGSYCNATDQPDYYGKVSYHWTSNGAPLNEQLKTYLDPGPTNALVLDGSANPCAPSALPAADFSGTPLTLATGSSVQFTDLTTGTPTSWSWTIAPGTAGINWTYITSTSATSQHPQVRFDVAGTYTITLGATNASGSDTEIKNSYITVTAPTAPCEAASTTCDEFIYNVSLNTIDNSTICTNYSNYTNLSTTLVQGQPYTVTVIPQIGSTPGDAYPDDEIAVWIDWNNDMDFADAGERVGYLLIGGPGTNEFAFNVPLTSTLGSLRMRCRISFLTGDGPISPCGETQYGEVEDYLVYITAPASTSLLTLNCGSNQQVATPTIPDVTAAAGTSTTCPGGVVNISQSPVAGTALQSGNNTVTVTATDNCGNTQTCQTVVSYAPSAGIAALSLESATIYPNPVSDLLRIDLSAMPAQAVTLELYDLTGKLLVSVNRQTASIIELDLQSVAAGTYQLYLRTDQSQVHHRLIKM